MPLGSYATFSECIASISRKKNPKTGKSYGKESAQRICGHIEKLAKQGRKDKHKKHKK